MDCFPLLVARLCCFKFKYARDCESSKRSLSIGKCLEKSNPASINMGNLKLLPGNQPCRKRQETDHKSGFYQVLFLLEDFSWCLVW
ncbi:hypothetical protein I79_000404 [Cricetulus griseus]|uniref:Uncharacterized protein n=1 Tax=Cricetulus griseus TaxID=10029 RepID=G3GS89_CRIGR|nr:hypothetical protein I79_000404 [Cricetulus griseus]